MASPSESRWIRVVLKNGITMDHRLTDREIDRSFGSLGKLAALLSGAFFTGESAFLVLSHPTVVYAKDQIAAIKADFIPVAIMREAMDSNVAASVG